MAFLSRIFKGKNPEALGVALVLTVAVFWGMFPILVNKGTQLIPPLFFAGCSALLGGLAAFGVSALKRETGKIFRKKTLFRGLMVALTMVAFPYALMFIGAKMTSGVNTAALELSEILFTIIITPFFGEKPTVYKTFGGVLVLVGAFVILFKGGSFNGGDLLIILSTVSLPFGNYFAKKALKNISGENLLVIRYFVGGIMLLAMSLLFENGAEMLSSLQNFWPYMVFNGMLLMGLVNILWYEGLKKLEICKAVFLLMTYPIFSLLFLTVFYGERPNFFQILGVFVIVLGAYFTARPSVSEETDALHRMS